MVVAAQAKAKELQESLSSADVSVWSCSAWDTEKARVQLDGTSLVVTIGGDGTILRAAQVVIQGATPIVGINLGKLGFMTELDADEALLKLPRLLAGEGWVDKRAMLEVELLVARQEPRTFSALNEVVLARGAVARVVYVDADIDGQHVSSYKADGIIVATATGSTGYSLAAGGPILYPQSRDFVLLPIAPHLSLDYPLVMPPTAKVSLRLTTFREATLSIDGHMNLPVASGDVVEVKLSGNSTRFLRLQPEGYFYSSLERRLKGK